MPYRNAIKEGEFVRMKPLTNYQRVVQYLNKIFKAINEHYFDNQLDYPTITIQTSRSAYGHVTTSKVWLSEEDKFSYELNIGAEYIARPIENVCATLIHEAVHLFCLKNGIKDTSNRGIYHNKRFFEIATKKDLEIEHHPKYGYSITKPTIELLMFCEENGFEDIQILRCGGFDLSFPKGKDGESQGTAGTTKPSSTRKYQCPKCKNSVRATKDLSIICGDCRVSFVKVK